MKVRNFHVKPAGHDELVAAIENWAHREAIKPCIRIKDANTGRVYLLSEALTAKILALKPALSRYAGV